VTDIQFVVEVDGGGTIRLRLVQRPTNWPTLPDGAVLAGEVETLEDHSGLLHLPVPPPEFPGPAPFPANVGAA